MRKTIFSLFVAVCLFAMNSVNFAQVDVSPNNATYANLKLAFLAINAGSHTANPTVTITASYNEPDSAVLTGANMTNCLITTNGTHTITGNANSPIIVLNDADFVTIDGRIGQTGSTRSLTITNTNIGTNNSIVCWRNGASNNTVKFINATTTTATGHFTRIMQIAQTVAGGTGGCNNNVIEENLLANGARGVQIFGTVNGANSFTNDNNVVRNNSIKNCTAIGVFIGSNVNGVVCEGNSVFFDAAVMTTQTSFTAIQNQAVGTVDIKRNKIYGFNLSGAPNAAYRGSISLPVSLLPNLPNPATTTVNYINNMISVVTNASTATFSGTCIQTQVSNTATFTSYNANVYNNTMYQGGSTSVAVGALSGAYTANVVTPPSTVTLNLKYKNNIAINGRSGGSTGAFHVAYDIDSAGVLSLEDDYNLAFANGTAANSWAAAFGSFAYPNGAIQAWKDNRCFGNDEQHSAFKNVNLTSATDLHIGGPVGGDLCGTPLAAVLTDIDGATRDASYPWKGAHENGTFKKLTLGAKLEGTTTAVDLRVALRNGACGIISTCNADVSGTGVFCFGDSITNGTGYRIDVFSTTHVRTLSSSATNSFAGGLLSYDFRTSAAQAFGANQVLDGASYAFYGGDITQDGTVDASDGAFIDTDAFNFLFGCNLFTDVNHDGSVDASDANIADNNAFGFVSVSTPCPEPTAPVVEASTPVLKTRTVNVEVNAAE